jgi:hypothetical protein
MGHGGDICERGKLAIKQIPSRSA